MKYISHNIGHEGKYSLLSELIKQDLCQALMTSASKRLQNHLSFFSIGINLTQKGIENIDEIIRIVFAYIHKLKEQGPQQYSFDELKKIHAIAFENKKRNTALEYAI